MQVKHNYGCPGCEDLGNTKAWEKHRRMCMACDAEMQRAEEVHQEAEEQEWKYQAEVVEKCWKEEEEWQQKEAEAKQKWEAKKARRAAAAEARKQQQADSEAQASRSWENMSVCQEKVSMQVVHKGQRVMAGMSPQGGECKKWAKKVVDNNDDDEIVILSSWKTKRQGGGKSLKEITD
ncbi:hypothetical protein ID866_12225 [Astraeus odoratus]|nr:hypothetical protein ID866_12225 [Astraeus odoratus]